MSELYNELGDFSKIKDEIDNWTLKPVSIDKANPMEMTELWLRS